MARALLLSLGLSGGATGCAPSMPLANVPPALELSGLAWYEEHLVMLPQYPDWKHDGAPCLYTVAKADTVRTP